MLLNHLTADLGAAIGSHLHALEHAPAPGEVSRQEQPINLPHQLGEHIPQVFANDLPRHSTIITINNTLTTRGRFGLRLLLIVLNVKGNNSLGNPLLFGNVSLQLGGSSARQPQ